MQGVGRMHPTVDGGHRGEKNQAANQAAVHHTSQTAITSPWCLQQTHDILISRSPADEAQVEQRPP